MPRILEACLPALLLLACSSAPSAPPQSPEAPVPETTPGAAGAAQGDAAPPQTSGGAAADPNLHGRCCDECSSAAGRDPAGMDLSAKNCLSYEGEFNGGPGVSEVCAAHFRSVPSTLGQCRQPSP